MQPPCDRYPLISPRKEYMKVHGITDNEGILSNPLNFIHRLNHQILIYDHRDSFLGQYLSQRTIQHGTIDYPVSSLYQYLRRMIQSDCRTSQCKIIAQK